jgi:ATP-dependent RNA helicase RhlE
MSFETLGLSSALLRAVAEQGYAQPTPIQTRVIPVALQGHDVMARAQTGTGKTAGFALPLLERLAAAGTLPAARRVRALILAPTRELAAQVGESIHTYGKHLSLRSGVVFGGVNINPQIAMLRKGLDILVATPGRLLDLAAQRHADLKHVEIFVLDEADRMLDMGFLPDIRRVIALLPPRRQNLLFSATFPDDIRALANKLLNDPVSVEVGQRNAAATQIEQAIYLVDKGEKRDVLSWLIGHGNWRQVLVFTRTKHGANRLAAQLESDGLRSVAIHGNKSQSARTRALDDFKRGAVRVLVATDIAARGLDIDELPHVVNFDLPDVAEHYVHRIGRTGRAGNDGLAVSLVAPDERPLLKPLERLLGRPLEIRSLDGYASREPHPPGAARARGPARDQTERGESRRTHSSERRHGWHSRHGARHGQRGARARGGRG